MKYSKTKTYYAIIEDEVEEVKFVKDVKSMYRWYMNELLDGGHIFSYKKGELEKEVYLNKAFETADLARITLVLELLNEKVKALEEKPWWRF